MEVDRATTLTRAAMLSPVATLIPATTLWPLATLTTQEQRPKPRASKCGQTCGPRYGRTSSQNHAILFSRLREILSVLDKGESLDRAALKRTLTHTADLLSMLADKPSEAV